jgi:5-methylcytosine-specific restriction protein A
MSFMPSFAVGSLVTNNEIMNEFGCGMMGGMRRSKKTNTLVLVSDHTKGFYDDKWYGEILHYTGMGKKEDQSINSAQNRTLAQSRTNGIAVHLFEVCIPKQYLYLGKVELCGEPFLDEQEDVDGITRNVWIFPIKPEVEGQSIPEVCLIADENNKRKQAKKLSMRELEQRARETHGGTTPSRLVSSQVYLRNQYVVVLAKRLAKGRCQLCNNEAPFIDKDGEPYLETHHIVWLSKDGADTMENTVALCPNCHRKMHILNLSKDIERLKIACEAKRRVR